MTDSVLLPRLDERSPTPLYHQITVHVQDLIERGLLKPGDQIPSERSLAEGAGVSRMTVRQAMRALVVDGWAERYRGRGIFVRSRPVIVDAHSFEGFTANTARQGLRSATRALSSRVARPPGWVAERLDLRAGGHAVELVRLRLIEDEPAVLETEWLSADLFPGLERHDLSRSLYAILEREYDTRIATTMDVLQAHLPSAEEQRLLQISRVPVIVRDRIGLIDDAAPIEVVRSVYHPARYEFRMTLVPSARAGDRAALRSAPDTGPRSA